MGLKVQYSRAQTKVLNRLNAYKGADVASAAVLTLGSDGNFFDITGTTTITHLVNTNWTAGARVTLQFDGACTVTHNSGTDTSTNVSLLLRGAVNMTTAAGDRLVLEYNGTNWLEVSRTTVGQQIFANRFGFAQGANVASAGTLTLGSDGNVFLLTGTTAIDYITKTGWAAGSVIVLLFGTSITLNHATGSVPATAAALSCFGAGNISATDKDVLMFVFDGTVWRQMAPISAI
jgi:hypothetical protein